MSRADRLDALLRDELHGADDLPVTSRYDAVLARSAQRTRRRRASWLAAVAVIAAATVGVSQLRPAAPAPLPAEKPTLHGTWTRTVDGNTWTITFGKSQVLAIDTTHPDQWGVDGASYSVEGSRVRTDAFQNGPCDLTGPGTYSWATSATLLSLQVESDSCQGRTRVLSGTWTAVP